MRAALGSSTRREQASLGGSGDRSGRWSKVRRTLSLPTALAGSSCAASAATRQYRLFSMPPEFKDRYAKDFLVGWRAMDFNGHMANTAYLDLAADVRLAFLADHGFPPTELRRLAIGPVIRKEELEYFREVNLHDTVTVTYAALASSPDGARFVIENEIWSAAGERAATVRSTGGWLDLRARKLVTPPPILLAALQHLPRAPGFIELPLPTAKTG